MREITYDHLRPSSPEDVRVFQEVFRQTPSYTFATQGKVATDDDAERLMNLVPHTVTADDKLILSISVNSKVVGCAIVVRGYPSSKIAFIGLLLVVHSAQGKSLGVDVLAHIEAIADSWGCDSLGIVVDSENHRAVSFWLREGFVVQQRKPSPNFVGDVVLMERKNVA